MSPHSLRTVDFTHRVSRALRERGVPPRSLTLEVTESLAFDIPEAVERLTPLRQLGVKISIDDFGTGYTSLSVLPRLPLDELKVDQQFVRAMLTSSASDAIVRSVLELAHRLGLSAVAEGVEDGVLAERLAGYGYDVLQGYHFSRPVPEGELDRTARRPGGRERGGVTGDPEHDQGAKARRKRSTTRSQNAVSTACEPVTTAKNIGPISWPDTSSTS